MFKPKMLQKVSPSLLSPLFERSRLESTVPAVRNKQSRHLFNPFPYTLLPENSIMDEHSSAVIQSMQRILNVDTLTRFGVNIITPGPNGDFKCIELLEHLIEMKKYVSLKLFKFAARILSDASEDRYGRSYFTTSRMDLLHVSVSIVSILKWKDWTLLYDSEELAAFYFAYAEKAIRCMEYNKHSNIENYTFVTTSLSHYFRCGYPKGLTVSEFNSELPYMLGQTIAMPMEHVTRTSHASFSRSHLSRRSMERSNPRTGFL
ncbi:hypothetical protein L596_027150 [Steinernema carpocapsae]|uniref:Uncharacterized protein n=1 Tax=Steinernema carpocapsae TaxID=34508 RepID=A0A4V5ZYD6_STECR|nr:hypothetical protein L596_027150 [Steinernema carpocapsae]